MDDALELPDLIEMVCKSMPAAQQKEMKKPSQEDDR